MIMGQQHSIQLNIMTVKKVPKREPFQEQQRSQILMIMVVTFGATKLLLRPQHQMLSGHVQQIQRL